MKDKDNEEANPTQWGGNYLSLTLFAAWARHLL